MMSLISMIDEFPSEREFRKRFPSRIYICFACGQMTPDPYVCIHCGSQANQLFPPFNFSLPCKGRVGEGSAQRSNVSLPCKGRAGEGSAPFSPFTIGGLGETQDSRLDLPAFTTGGVVHIPASKPHLPPIYRYKISGIHNEVQQIFRPIEYNNKKG